MSAGSPPTARYESTPATFGTPRVTRPGETARGLTAPRTPDHPVSISTAGIVPRPLAAAYQKGADFRSTGGLGAWAGLPLQPWFPAVRQSEAAPNRSLPLARKGPSPPRPYRIAPR